MSSILDALKKLENEQAESAQDPGNRVVFDDETILDTLGASSREKGGAGTRRIITGVLMLTLLAAGAGGYIAYRTLTAAPPAVEIAKAPPPAPSPDPAPVTPHPPPTPAAATLPPSAEPAPEPVLEEPVVAPAPPEPAPVKEEVEVKDTKPDPPKPVKAEKKVKSEPRPVVAKAEPVKKAAAPSPEEPTSIPLPEPEPVKEPTPAPVPEENEAAPPAPVATEEGVSGNPVGMEEPAPKPRPVPLPAGQPLNIFAFPGLRKSDATRLNLPDIKLNMPRPATRTRPYASAILNLQPVMVGEDIPGTDATLIAVDMRGIAIEVRSTGERFHIGF